MVTKKTYEDKLYSVANFLNGLRNDEQIAILEEVPDDWTMEKRVDYLYDRMSQILATHHPGIRFSITKPSVPNALVPKEEMEEGDRGSHPGFRDRLN